MNRSLRSTCAALAALALAFHVAHAAPAAPRTVALVGGTVHPVSGPELAHATVLVKGDRIAAVGADVAVPSDATVIDCTGKHVYPGLVAANTQIGLIEISTIEGSNDTRETGNVNPDIRAEVMLNPDSDFLPVARIQGITSAQLVPGGGAIHGTSAVVHLDGWTPEDMTLRAPVGLHVDWPDMAPVRGPANRSTDEEQDKRREEAIAAIRTAFENARAYETARTAEGRPGVPSHDQDARWDAMRAVIRGQVPVWFHAQTLAQLRAVLRFIDEQHLSHCVIVGGRDAVLVADELKARDIAVVVAGTLALPPRRGDAYDAAFTLPARLAKAGVRFCISTPLDSESGAMLRNLGHHAAMAAAFGLPADAALRSVTLDAARILGVGDRVGSIEVGKVADLQVTDGDPLEATTRVERVLIAGTPIVMESRQTRLFKKYDARPRGPKARPR